jgi:hypothetical protein
MDRAARRAAAERRNEDRARPSKTKDLRTNARMALLAGVRGFAAIFIDGQQQR